MMRGVGECGTVGKDRKHHVKMEVHACMHSFPLKKKEKLYTYMAMIYICNKIIYQK